MFKIACAAFLGVLLATGTVLAGEGEERAYDREGRYQGRTTGDRMSKAKR